MLTTTSTSEAPVKRVARSSWSSPAPPRIERVPGMRAHLEGCPACDEDHDSLLAFVESRQA